MMIIIAVVQSDYDINDDDDNYDLNDDEVISNNND